MVIGLVGPVTLMPGPLSAEPWRAMAVYEVIGRPPSLAGGLNVIVTEPSPPWSTQLAAGPARRWS